MDEVVVPIGKQIVMDSLPEVVLQYVGLGLEVVEFSLAVLEDGETDEDDEVDVVDEGESDTVEG